MGEISKRIIVVLALLVIVVSAIGTWTVMNAAMDVFGGSRIPVSGSQSVAAGVVRVNVNDAPQPPISGRVNVQVSGGE